MKKKIRELENKLKRMIKAKKDQWEEFGNFPNHYSKDFILRKANEIDGIISETIKELKLIN